MIIYAIAIVRLVVTMLGMVPIHHHQPHVMLKIVPMLVTLPFPNVKLVQHGGKTILLMERISLKCILDRAEVAQMV